MKKKILLLFDVDGTIAYSGKKIDSSIKSILDSLPQDRYEFGIVGGGEKTKIIEQIDGLSVHHLFTECGCNYYKKKDNGEFDTIYEKDIQKHEIYPQTKSLIGKCLEFIALEVNCNISGKFIDRRKGLFYVSLVGMQASEKERQDFIIEDNLYHYRDKILQILKNTIRPQFKEKIDVKIGGSTGITIIPSEWNKSQVMKSIQINDYEKILFFGDKYKKDGNDYELLQHVAPNFFGVCVDTPQQTRMFLDNLS